MHAYENRRNMMIRPGPPRTNIVQQESWPRLGAMIGENRQRVTDEPVEFEENPVEVQDCRKRTDHFQGIYRIYPNLTNENWRMSTCNRLDLQTLGSRPLMLKNLPDHWLGVEGTKRQASGKMSPRLLWTLQSHHSTLYKLQPPFSKYTQFNTGTHSARWKEPATSRCNNKQSNGESNSLLPSSLLANQTKPKSPD